MVAPVSARVDGGGDVKDTVAGASSNCVLRGEGDLVCAECDGFARGVDILG